MSKQSTYLPWNNYAFTIAWYRIINTEYKEHWLNQGTYKF